MRIGLAKKWLGKGGVKVENDVVVRLEAVEHDIPMKTLNCSKNN